MPIYSTVHDSITIITFEDEDQLHDPNPLRAVLMEQIKNGHIQFIIDLQTIVYISSSVLGLFITLYQDLKSRGGTVKFLNVQPSVSSVFEITRLNRILEIYNDKQTAINSFQ